MTKSGRARVVEFSKKQTKSDDFVGDPRCVLCLVGSGPVRSGPSNGI